MQYTIFFSWQNDTPAKQGHYLVEEALKDAIRRLSTDASVEEAIRDELEFDKDTKGVPGSPPIFDAILSKIDRAAIFVPDLTFVGTRLKGLPTPNPNVLLEYGWALKTLGPNRIIAVMNAAYGEPTKTSMPFDLAHRRFPITYYLSDDASIEARRVELKKLTDIFVKAIGDILRSESINTSSPVGEGVRLFEPLESPDDGVSFRGASFPLGFGRDPETGKSTPVYFLMGPTAWLRLMPHHLPDRTWSIKELKDAVERSGHRLVPMLFSDLRSIKEEDGYGLYDRSIGAQTNSVAFAFESGEVWSLDSSMLRHSHRAIYLQLLFEKFCDVLPKYVAFLQTLGVEAPYRWIAGIDGVKNWELVTQEGRVIGGTLSGPECMSNRVTKDGVFTPGESPKLVLRTFFEEICRRSMADYPNHFPFI
jgi:hypothetical protein